MIAEFLATHNHEDLASGQGQFWLFISFLVSSGVQVWREWLQRRDSRAKEAREKSAAAEKELRDVKRAEELKHQITAQHQQLQEQVKQRVETLSTRLNGLLEPEQ